MPAARAGIVVRPELRSLGERLVHARLAALGRVPARVDDEPVQPGGELRVAAELLQAHAELRERLLRGVARVLGIAQDLAREPLDLRRVPRAQRLERERGRRPSRASREWDRSASRRREPRFSPQLAA